MRHRRYYTRRSESPSMAHLILLASSTGFLSDYPSTPIQNNKLFSPVGHIMPFQLWMRDLHNAMSTSMIMNQRPLSRRPNENQYIRLAVTMVHKVARIVSGKVGVSVLVPIPLGRSVASHSLHKVVDIDF
jgi:hypothetical protein